MAAADDVISLRYILIHRYADVEAEVKRLVIDAMDLETIDDIQMTLELNNAYLGTGAKLTRLQLRLHDVDYDRVETFEEYLVADSGLEVAVKVSDSSKLSENQHFMGQLYDLEMKIREIYSVLLYRLGLLSLLPSEVQPIEARDLEYLRRNLANDLFFVGFAAYKTIDRKHTREHYKLRARELAREIELARTHGDLHHVERALRSGGDTLGMHDVLPEARRIAEAIGHLESFRHTIAHNRHLAPEQVANFHKAKTIIDEVYDAYIDKLWDNL